jgi:probable phosphoglycerate mutase
MKKNIYFLRHGESLENVGDKIRMKHKDAILTKNGVFQAEQVASRMKNINLDIVFTSHYDRALKTAEKIANDSDIDFSILDFAYERKYPESAYGLKRKSMEDVEIIDKFKKT